jgi:L,D-transpeptidase catalytic domain/Putative peptidoglycan binding domain
VRSPVFIAVVVGLALVFAGAAGVYAYDHAREDEIARGITVGGVDVGGLDRAKAEQVLRVNLVEPLQQPVVVRARGRRFRLTAERSRIRADIRASVEEAIARSRSGTMAGRAWRAITGGEVDADVEPRVRFSDAAVRRLVRRVRRSIDRPVRDASVDLNATGLRKRPARTGLKLDGERLGDRVATALTSLDDRSVRASIRRVEPKVTLKDLARKYDTVVTIERGAYRLRLFKKLKPVATYPIAVGQAGLETPAGRYTVQNKAVNPSWHVPNSSWAGALAGRVIPPGPENPIKARWMGIYDGAGIHGTDAVGSIGTNASHGCIRMLIPDVVELYDKVPVGAPVYIA